MPPELGHALEQILHAVSKLPEPCDPVHATLCHGNGCSRATRVVRGRRSPPVADLRSPCYRGGMARWIGVAVAVLAAIALIIALGEDGERAAQAPAPAPTLVPAPRATSTTVAGDPASSTTSTVPSAAPEPAAAVRPLETPEDARRMLEEAGIDEAEVSGEVGEHMERRFEER